MPVGDPELAELRRTLIRQPDHWRWINQVMASSGKAISPKMTYLLALVIFEGYELFPASKQRRK